MTLQDIKQALDDIKTHERDAEYAHNIEDALHLDLLKSIAAGTCEDPRACAALAITSEAMDFPRWCA